MWTYEPYSAENRHAKQCVVFSGYMCVLEKGLGSVCEGRK